MLKFLKSLFGAKDNGKIRELFQQDAVLIDVRSPEEFAAGSVKNAINIPVNRINVDCSKLKFGKPIIVFCKSGSRSAMAKSLLEAKGFNNVENGGSWQNVNSIANEKLN